MHEVQALIRRRLPGAISARTDWMFGSQRRGVRRCECDTAIPKPGPLPQISHTAATADHSQIIVYRRRGTTAPASRPLSSLTVPSGERRHASLYGSRSGTGSLRIAGPVPGHGYPPAVLQALDDAAVGEWYRTAV